MMKIKRIEANWYDRPRLYDIAFSWDERTEVDFLEAVFAQYSPSPRDRRAQHSDSGMAHLLPVLSGLNFNSLNLGPTVRADEIRKHHPKAVIEGQLAPFTFSRNEEVNIVAEFLRDFEMTRDTRGLSFTTAGSINNGSLLTGMRLIMAAIQRYGRYQ